MPNNDPLTPLLRLTLTPGLGPVLIARALAAIGSPEAVLTATEAQLRRVKGIGEEKARSIAAALPASEPLAHRELELASRLGVRIIPITDPDYPPLLRQISDPPPVLYVLGTLDPAARDRFPVAIVGSRTCSAYGIEQAERFSAQLAQAGLTIISGGARGIDTAAHRAALRVRSMGAPARTIAVLGCGLARRYPPDNADLFDQITADDGAAGALVSELPLETSPSAENFPARNRIISGLALGVVVIEAGRRSGALITARLAAEDHGREVFALPARVDSAASEGSLSLLKSGGAAIVTHPADVIDALEAPARHHFNGAHADRYTDPARTPDEPFEDQPLPLPTTIVSPTPRAIAPLTPSQELILRYLDRPLTLDELSRASGLDPGVIRAELTPLELSRRIRREGSRVTRSS